MSLGEILTGKCRNREVTDMAERLFDTPLGVGIKYHFLLHQIGQRTNTSPSWTPCSERWLIMTINFKSEEFLLRI